MPEVPWTGSAGQYELRDVLIRDRLYSFRITRLRDRQWQLLQTRPYVDRLGYFDTLEKAKRRVERAIRGSKNAGD